MKTKIPLIIIGIILFIFITCISIVWYNIFYHQKEDVSVLQIGKENEKNATLNISNMIPMSDEEGAKITPYKFTIKNSGDDKIGDIYRVLIEDIEIKDDPTYENKSLLSRNQLKYQLTMNNKLIKKGKLSDIKNNILDERSIEKTKENKYELRIYLGTDIVNTDWQEKYYHYRINIQKMEG